MITIHREDEVLDDLIGATIPSEVSSDIGYRIVARGAEGTMYASYYAVRTSPEGESPVVVKVLRPSFHRKLGKTAPVVVKKEAVSLGRLNERVPPTPFVVRLIDTGTYKARRTLRSVPLPWITIEYVHGGAQGTTLRQRVRRTIKATGHAFDPARAARALSCMTSGLMAVHEVGVIHRAISPTSILCCGAGDDEVFKLSDFGLARPEGLKDTLTARVLEEAGAGPPELVSSEPDAVGPWTDVFCLAATIFYLLTGELYFPTATVQEAITAVGLRGRRSILEGKWLHPKLRAQESACRSIDFALRWATAASPEERVQEPEALTSMILSHLRPEVVVPRLQERDSTPPPSTPAWLKHTVRLARVVPNEGAPPTQRLGSVSVESEIEPSQPRVSVDTPWKWTMVHHPGSAGVIRSVAWDGYGRCLAASTEGLLFWNGTSWCPAALEGLDGAVPIRFVHRIGAGRWLVGGDGPALSIVTTGGLAGVVQRPAGRERGVAMSGDLEDMGVLATAAVNGPAKAGPRSAPGARPPNLHTFLGRRWLRPLPVEGAAHLASMVRVQDARWLIACRSDRGKGMLALYQPLDFRMDHLIVPDVRAFIACAGRPEIGVGIAVGSDGAAVWYVDGGTHAEVVEPGRDLSATALGPDDSAWAAGAGRIWRRRSADPPGAGTWQCVWADENWVGPIVSLFVDSGVVVAMSADGGILEGRSG